MKREVSAQTTMVALACAAWAFIGRPSLLVLVCAYLVAWWLVGALWFAG